MSVILILGLSHFVAWPRVRELQSVSHFSPPHQMRQVSQSGLCFDASLLLSDRLETAGTGYLWSPRYFRLWAQAFLRTGCSSAFAELGLLELSSLRLVYTEHPTVCHLKGPFSYLHVGLCRRLLVGFFSGLSCPSLYSLVSSILGEAVYPETSCVLQL